MADFTQQPDAGYYVTPTAPVMPPAQQAQPEPVLPAAPAPQDMMVMNTPGGYAAPTPYETSQLQHRQAMGDAMVAEKQAELEASPEFLALKNESIKAQQSAMEQYQYEQERRKQELEAAQMERDAQIRSVRDEKIDPDRYWNNRTTGQKILMAIGAALSGKDPHVLINAAVERDMMAQKLELDKQRSLIDSLQVNVSEKRKLLDEVADEFNFARAQKLELVKMKVEGLMGRVQSQQGKAQLEQLYNKIAMDQETAAEQVRQMAARRAMGQQVFAVNTPGGWVKVSKSEYLKNYNNEKQAQTENDRILLKAQLEKQSEKSKYAIKGLVGSAGNPATHTRALETYNGLQGLETQAKKWFELRDKYFSGGGPVNLNMVTRSKIDSLHAAMLTNYAKVETGGVVTKTDEANAARVLPNPKDLFGGAEVMSQVLEMARDKARKHLNSYGYAIPNSTYVER